MSAISNSKRDLEAPPPWLRWWCFFLGCIVPAGAITLGLIGGATLMVANEDLTNWGLQGSLLVLFAFYACGMFLIIRVGTRVAFYHDAEAANSVAWLCGVVGGVVLVVSCVVGTHEQFGLTDWVWALTSVYYLATTAILHARLCYLSRRYERLIELPF